MPERKRVIDPENQIYPKQREEFDQLRNKYIDDIKKHPESRKYFNKLSKQDQLKFLRKLDRTRRIEFRDDSSNISISYAPK